jgi:hypothetical protein
VRRAPLVEGHVVDRTGSAVSGAIVQTVPIADGIVTEIAIRTGRDGRYQDFNVVARGSYKTIVTAEGFRPSTQIFEVGAGKRIELAFVLESDS